MVRALGLRRSASLLNNSSRASSSGCGRKNGRCAIGAVYASLIEHDPQGATPVVDLN
jgi:hypothetical protein